MNKTIERPSDMPRDPLGLAALLLDNADRTMSVYVVQCGSHKIGWMPKTVRRELASAMMYCLDTWGIAPVWTDPGYWREEMDSGVVIEIYEMALEP